MYQSKRSKFSTLRISPSPQRPPWLISSLLFPVSPVSPVVISSPALFLRPFRHTSRSPRSSSSFHILLQFAQIVRERMELAKLLRKFPRSDVVRIHVRLRRLCQREPLSINDRIHPIIDRRWHRLIY